MKTPLALFFFLTCILVYGQAPRLVVPVGHTGEIISSAVSPDGKQVLTGSKDKTAKLWDSSGRLLQTFVGHTDRVNAVAFSPDGTLVLTGSNDKKTKLWDLSGNILQTFTGHNDYINYVAFSRDGKKVLTAGWETAKLWDLSGRMLLEFKKYRIPTPKIPWYMGKRKSYRKMRHLFFLADDNKNVLVQDDDDGETRILADSSWGVEYYKNYGMRYLKMQYDSLVPRVPSSQRLDLFRSYSQRDSGNDKYTSKTVREITSVGFTSDKKFIVLGCGCYDHTERALDVFGRKVQTIDSTSTEWKAALSSSGDNSEKLWVFSGRMSRSFKHAKTKAFSPDHKNLLTVSKNNTAKLWDSSGKMLFQRIPNNKETTSVVFSPDGKTILIGGWDFTPLQKAERRKRNGAVFMSGRDDSQELWDLSGQVMQSFKGLGFENKAAFSPACPNDPNGGGIILTTNEEMTSNLWDTKSGKLLATLFILDSTDWVVTTPAGLFDASPGAMNLMYFVQGLEVIELEQLKKRYWEPGLLAQIMQNKRLRDVSSFGTLPLYPEIEAGISDNKLHVKLTERSGGIGKLSLFVNGNEVAVDVNPNKKTALDIDLSQFNEFYLDTNTLALRVFIAEGWFKSQAYELRYIPVASKGQGNKPSGAKTSFSPGLPHLYAIVVGTSEYANTTMKLRFPDLDAEAFAQALQASGARLFPERVHLQLLSTAAGQKLANKNNIQAAFEVLMNDQVKAGDILVVYFSGHGITYGPAENSQFYYLTKDVPGPDLSIPEDRKHYTVSSEEITGWLKKIHALKRVLIFDACNAGSLAKAFEEVGAKEFNPSQIRAYDEMKDRTGTFILAGAAADKVSFESGEYGQGLLTYSLLEGMSGLALLDDKRVDVMKLFQHARTTVPNLAKGINKAQTPMMAFPKGRDGGSGASFSIGKVDALVKMPPLKAVKPVYIKSVFLAVPENEDVLELGQALADYFDKLSLGANAPLHYVPVDKYENGYKISGTYSITGETVQINGILKKGAVKKGSFEVKGAKNNIRGLVEQMVDKVQAIVDGE